MRNKDQILLESAYEQILQKKIDELTEAKKEVNPYAVCTSTVGRKDEAKYKSCKEKVIKGAKKLEKK